MTVPRVTIPELPAQAAIVESDLLVVQNGATTKKMTVGTLTVPSVTALNAHIANPTDAHDASAVSATANTAPMTGTNVQLQLAQAGTEIAAVKTTANGASTGLANHLADTVDAHDASAISFVPTGTVAATEVQAAIAEVASEAASNLSTLNGFLANHISDTSDAHDASAISCLPAGNLSSTDVQAALTELQVSVDTVVPGVFTATVNGLVPAPTTTSGRVLSDAGTWVAPAAGGGGGGEVADGDKGDIVVSGSGATWMLDSTVVTPAAKTVLDDTTTTAMRTTLGAQTQSTNLDAWTQRFGPADAGTPDKFILYEAGAWGSNYMLIAASPNLTANRNISFPDADGTVALTDPNLTTWSSRFYPRGTSLPDAVIFFEATTFGDNYIHLLPPSQLNETRVIYFPDAAGTLALTTQTILAKAGTAISSTPTDASAYLWFNGTNPTYTVQPNSAVSMMIGTRIDGIGATSAMTIAPGAGVTIERARTLVTLGRGSGWSLIKIDTDTWNAHGDFV